MAVAETRFRVMASDAQMLVVDGPHDAGTAAKRALDQLEATWSRFIDDSDVSRLNHSAGAPVPVTRPTITLVELMLEGWRNTSGRFDPTVLRSLVAAGYASSIEDPSRRTTLPREPNLDDLTTATFGDTVVSRRDQTIMLPAGISIDPGGIGKGLAADLVIAELLARGAKGVLLGIGGDLAAAGDPPSDDGWPVEVEDPSRRSSTLVRLWISGGGVATSSTLSRRWSRGGDTKHHVINPATARPSQTDLTAVTVVAPCGWIAEIHATSLLLAGSNQLLDHAERANVEAVATTAGGQVVATPQLACALASTASA